MNKLIIEKIEYFKEDLQLSDKEIIESMKHHYDIELTEEQVKDILWWEND